MKLIAYVRVSRVAGREGPSFISPSVQREKVQQYAGARSHVIVGWEEDLDQPGNKADRPAFQAALAAVERGEAEGIIVASLDRFGRSVADATVALRRLADVEAVLVSVRENLDTSTSMGKFAQTMMFGLAELELDRVRENWATASSRAISQGRHIGRPPVGYRKGADGRLEPDPVAAPVIQELFRRKAVGVSLKSLGAYLDEALPRRTEAPGGTRPSRPSSPAAPTWARRSRVTS